MPVRRYSLQLSKASLSVLRGLVGRAVHRVYASCLQVDKRHLTAPSISIPTSDETKDGWVHRYVIVRCEWFETPETRTDYWQLFVDNEDKPSGIDLSDSKGIVAPCTINFYGHSSPIMKVEVYKFSWPANEQVDAENVIYDRAIRFQRQDGSSFCIACQLNGPGIATEVNISDEEETIADLLSGCTLRVSIP
jgi:hypothetical protein